MHTEMTVQSRTAACTRAMHHLTCLLHGEDGMVSWATVIIVVFVCFLGALLMNAGQTINQKIETQNAADSVAYTSALWMARGLNAVTAANHMMGELTAIYVLHQAIGGTRLDTTRAENHSDPISRAQSRLNRHWNTLLRPVRLTGPVLPPQEVYDAVKALPYSDNDSTVYCAKMRLKACLIWAYTLHELGYVTYWAGVVAGEPASGEAMMQAAVAMQWEILREYRVLDGLEALAKNLSPKKQAIPGILQALSLYERTIVREAPLAATAAAAQVASRNQVRGFALPQSLPVTQDPVASIERCQLMRATYPWLNFWRKYVVDFLKASDAGAPLSAAPHFYIYWTDEYSRRAVREFTQSGNGLHLHLLGEKGTNGENKGREQWTTTTNKAHQQTEKLFCTFGLARQLRPPTIAAPSFLRQENPDGVICFAQAICYNANHQVSNSVARKNRNSVFQQWIGWDTLNWYSTGPDSRAVEFAATARLSVDPLGTLVGLSWLRVPRISAADQPGEAGFPQLSPSAPAIRLNWQAKLVPLTYNKIGESLETISTIDPELGSAMSRRLTDKYKQILAAVMTH
jgi:hypothetical protein